MLSDNDRVEDILRAARRLGEIVSCTRESFDRDWTLRDAAERELEIIGEAANSLSNEFCARVPGLPIAEAKALRNLIAHQYREVDYGVIWQTISKDVPELAAQLSDKYTPTATSSVFDEDVAIRREGFRELGTEDS